MRGLVLLVAAALATTGAALPFAAPALGQNGLQSGPQSGQMSAQVRAGVDAWTAGNFETAIKAWQGPAAKGDADALFNLGQAYKLGRGVPKDLAKAETMYGKAAKLGHVRAADNYGIILFQTNRQQAAIPWLQSAADRGEPRAMYVLGIASYNGDFAPKDWVRAYALITRAAATGLPQAATSLATMNETIPLAQRQMGVSLASELEQKAADARNRELAAADLGAGSGIGARPQRPAPPLPAPSLPSPVEQIALPPSAPMAGTENEAQGYTEAAPMPPPRSVTPKSPAPKPAAPKLVTPKPPAARPAPDTGPYRIQLGAFGQKSNADALWSRVRGRPEIAGHARADLGSPVARLLATGYTQAGAQHACAALKAGGLSCLVINP